MRPSRARVFTVLSGGDRLSDTTRRALEALPLLDYAAHRSDGGDARHVSCAGSSAAAPHALPERAAALRSRW